MKLFKTLKTWANHIWISYICLDYRDVKRKEKYDSEDSLGKLIMDLQDIKLDNVFGKNPRLVTVVTPFKSSLVLVDTLLELNSSLSTDYDIVMLKTLIKDYTKLRGKYEIKSLYNFLENRKKEYLALEKFLEILTDCLLSLDSLLKKQNSDVRRKTIVFHIKPILDDIAKITSSIGKN